MASIIIATLIIETALFVYGRSAGHIGSVSTGASVKALPSYKGTVTKDHNYQII